MKISQYIDQKINDNADVSIDSFERIEGEARNEINNGGSHGRNKSYKSM
jgi:hypothetical protein